MKKLFTIGIAIALLALSGCTTKGPAPETNTPEEVLESIRTTLNEKEEITAKLYNLTITNTNEKFEEEGTYVTNNKKADVKTVFYTIEDDMRVESGELIGTFIGKEGRIHGGPDNGIYPFGRYYPTLSDYLQPIDHIQVDKEESHYIYTYRNQLFSSVCVEIDENNHPVKLTAYDNSNISNITYEFTDITFS